MRCSGDSSAQWPKTQRSAAEPECSSARLPVWAFAPGTGPKAVANADKAMSVETAPSGAVMAMTFSHAVGSADLSPSPVLSSDVQPPRASKAATNSVAAVRACARVPQKGDPNTASLSPTGAGGTPRPGAFE
ncbi:hypothetical protein [Yinghuangia sp. YIM S10712]|uniref:hypothetical protein n=1 Tax=Yinghuangia sp. YIM S10712 TaxID=3436930 RepID=UPI003F534CCF